MISTQPLNNKKKVYEAFSNSLNSGNIVMYHGTSLVVLENIIQTGRQKGTNYTREDKEMHLCIREGDIFAFPIRGKTHDITNQGAPSKEEALKWTCSYANSISLIHYFWTTLNMRSIPSQDEDIIISGSKTTNPIHWFFDKYQPNIKIDRQPEIEIVYPIYSLLIKNGFNQTEIDELVEKSKKKKGIVIGLSNSVIENNTVLPGNDGRDIRFLNCSIDDILGIKPLDQESYDFLNNLGSH